jgi:hypothetical protein
MTKLTFSFKFFCFRLQIDTYASWLIKLSEFLYFMTCDTVAALIIFFFFLKMSIIFCHHKNSMTFPFSTLSNLVNLSPNSSQKKKKKSLNTIGTSNTLPNRLVNSVLHDHKTSHIGIPPNVHSKSSLQQNFSQ